MLETILTDVNLFYDLIDFKYKKIYLLIYFFKKLNFPKKIIKNIIPGIPTILSIDIGIINMGITKAIIYPTYTFKIISCRLINILGYTCRDKHCTFGHKRSICDCLNHLFKNSLFDTDIILLEKQPITGLTSVEELILNKFRTVTCLIYPTSMHIALGIDHLDYEHRKIMTVKFAEKYISHFPDFSHERKHDMSDSMCFIIYFFQIMKLNKPIIKPKIENKQFLNSNSNFSNFISQFKYKG